METIKRSILLTRFNVTINTWNNITRRFSDSSILRSGRCIKFEGTEEAFDDLLDKLYEDESNFKVIGVYN